jgi:hypothetical protein
LNDTLKISHLVVNGCSYTYGHGIIDPIQNAWASIIAKRLGVPLVNLALPGQGNTAIYRRTMTYFYKDLFNHNNPFYIHAYSQSTRREVYLAKTQQFRIVGGDGEISALEKEIIMNSDDHYYCLLQQDKLHRWASINHLLDAHNVPHLMSDYMPETIGTTIEFQEKHETILKTELECHPGKLKDFNEVTKHIEKTSCLHETEEGHAFLADYIWKEIENRYDDIEVVDLPHAKLHDILIHTPKTEADVEQSLTEINENPIDYYPLDFFRNVYYFHELGLDYTKKNWFGKPSIPEKP